MSTSTGSLAPTETLRARSVEPAATLPRLLAGIRPGGAMTLDEHLELHGVRPSTRSQRRRQARERGARLIDELERSGLLGRGGGGFPLARKLRAVAAGRGRAIVIVNGAEGEPASLKDATLSELLPHLVLDGAEIAAEAVGADEAIVAVCESATTARAAMREAIHERADGDVGLSLASVPSGYVAGQESALVSYLGGGAAKPTFTPPMPFEQGLRRRPTLISNVETLAHAALIARHGAAWFRELGIASEPGSALVTVSGPLAHAGVYEIEHGSSLSSLIQAAGGVREPVRGMLVGGYSGTWIGARDLRGVALSREHLAVHGATLGAGVVLLLSERACPVAETVRLARWMSAQGARQCGPCEHGLQALADAVEELALGEPGAARRIERLQALTAGRGACAHPDGAVAVTLSALDAFSQEFLEHARGGPCDRCAGSPELPLPYP